MLEQLQRLNDQLQEILGNLAAPTEVENQPTTIIAMGSGSTAITIEISKKEIFAHALEKLQQAHQLVKQIEDLTASETLLVHSIAHTTKHKKISVVRLRVLAWGFKLFYRSLSTCVFGGTTELSQRVV